jgi:hypothetical protein
MVILSNSFTVPGTTIAYALGFEDPSESFSIATQVKEPSMSPTCVFKPLLLILSSSRRVSCSTLLFFLFFTFGIMFPKMSGSSFAQKPSDVRQNAAAEQLTHNLIGLFNRYLSANPAERSQLKDEFIKINFVDSPFKTGNDKSLRDN